MCFVTMLMHLISYCSALVGEQPGHCLRMGLEMTLYLLITKNKNYFFLF
jgi:hypothetical protein